LSANEPLSRRREFLKDSLERRTLLWAVAIGGIVLINAAICYRAVSAFFNDYHWVNHTRQVEIELVTTQSLMTDAETGTRGFVITGNDAYLEPYNNAVREIGQQIDEVRKLIADNEDQRKRLDELAALINQRLQTLQNGQKLRREEGLAGVQRQQNSLRGKEEMDRIRAVIGEMIDREDKLLSVRESEAEQNRQRIFLTFTFATLLALALIAAITLLLRRTQAERQRSMNLVQEQKDWLAVTLTSIGDAVIATDTQGRVTFVNPVAESLTGWSHDQASGQPLDQVFRIVNEETRLTVESPVTKVLREGVVVGLANHTILLSKDGREIPVDDSGAPIRKESDQSIAGVILVFRDVTERKRNEKTMRALQERFAKAFSASPVPMSIVTYDEGRYVDVNESFLKENGYTREEVIGRTTTEMNIYVDNEERDRLRQIVIEQGRLRNYEVRRRLKTGEIRVALASSEIIDLHGERCILTTTFDITDREIAEATRARLAAIVESSDDAIIGKDLQGIITSWNAGAERIFGYSADEMIGRPVTVLHPPDRAEEEIQILERLRRGEPIDHFETVRVRKDGHPIDVALTVSPIKDGTGRIIGASKISRDITDRKKAEKERERLLASEKEARAEAEAANRLKDEFLATVSHELRTPLTAILGWSALLKQDASNEQAVRKAMEVIERNAKAQTQIIGDILDVSRIITGKLSLDLQPVELDLVIHAAINTVRPAIDGKEIILKVHLEPQRQVVFGDPNRLQQIVWNLLSNAVKFTPKGGSIDIGLKHIDSNVEISVRDSGMGIGKEFLPYVFERFRQADASMTRSHGGLGLGLSIVRHLVEMHGGMVSAESDGENKGSMFKVTLPAAAISEVAPMLGGYAPARVDTMGVESVHKDPMLNGLRILVVDDQADTREIIARVLANSGAEVKTASAADEAMDIFLQWKPEILISDLGMPTQDGIHFIRKIRSLQAENGATVPAIALTAYTREEDRTAALSAGYDLHLPKPATPSELVTAVSSLTKPHQPGSI